MIKLSDILGSYFAPTGLKESYKNKVKSTVNSKEIDWEIRAVEATKSILAAVCFKESSISLTENTENLIFPPIGFYYSLFHLSVGLLKLDYSINLEQLENIHHGSLFKLFESKFISTKIISSNYIDYFKMLKELREYCNYKFGYSTDLRKELEISEQLTDKCFDEAISLIHQILNLTSTQFRFATSIGDHFGDDIISSYLSGEEEDRIWEFLVLNNLTT